MKKTKESAPAPKTEATAAPRDEQKSPAPQPAERLPEQEELVICKCTKILQYGAFFELIEYPGVEGFCHISEVSSGWVKNIYSVLSKGQMYVAKVTRINLERQELNISIKRVSESAKKEKLKEWQYEKRARALFKVACEKAGVKEEEAFEKYGPQLVEKYETFYKALEEIRFNPSDAVPESMPEKLKKSMTEVLEKAIEVPKKTVRGVIKITSGEPDGVEVLKEALKAAAAALKATEYKIYSEGAPKYAINVTTKNYKTSEKALNSAVEKAQESLKKHKNSSLEFERLKD